MHKCINDKCINDGPIVFVRLGPCFGGVLRIIVTKYSTVLSVHRTFIFQVVCDVFGTTDTKHVRVHEYHVVSKYSLHPGVLLCAQSIVIRTR